MIGACGRLCRVGLTRIGATVPLTGTTIAKAISGPCVMSVYRGVYRFGVPKASPGGPRLRWGFCRKVSAQSLSLARLRPRPLPILSATAATPPSATSASASTGTSIFACRATANLPICQSASAHTRLGVAQRYTYAAVLQIATLCI